MTVLGFPTQLVLPKDEEGLFPNWRIREQAEPIDLLVR
jgi:hypothetical protein